uniref:Light-mediated development protein DET1 n=1 Tax=Aegilops tauschii subsp. strangulata TaxID=200361 RepID=A0A453EUW0_AEGTS
MVGFFRSGNLASRVFDRQFLSPRPGATVNTVRQFYENLVPSYTIYDIDCPDYSFRKFTDDGKYLVAFSRNHQDLIVYRPIWLTFSCHEECDSHDLPANAERFDSFFKQLYSISLASSNEYICSLVEVRRIGAFCREDDELFLYSHGQAAQGNSFLPGIKQRLLSYIFRKTWNEEPDQALRVQHLKKKFYFHFQDYVDLIIWKVQFLDRRHLFIKFGSVDGGVTRSTDQNLAFFAVYNMETTDIVSLYQNSSEELYSLFEHYYDHFHANPQNSSHEKFISSHSNSVHALDQLCTIKNKASSSSQFVKKMMASLPYTCQSQSPSPYFDLSIFRYDEKLISAIDRHRHCTEHPIKFISVRQPNVVKFKIKPGSDSGGSDSRAKRISSFLFHPFFPLALSIQQTYMQPTVVNVHFRR